MSEVAGTQSGVPRAPFFSYVFFVRLEKETAPGDADHAAGHFADERRAAGEEGGVRSAVAERDAEALRRADGHVDAELARRLQQRQRQQVRGAARQSLHGKSIFDQVFRFKIRVAFTL